MPEVLENHTYRTVDLFGVSYAVVDYQSASRVIVENAENRKSFGVSALAVHGLITSRTQATLRERIRKIPLIVPDGQPVRWAMNLFHQTGLKDRVYGPTLALHVLGRANEKRLKLFLYGSTPQTLEKFSEMIRREYPAVQIVGIHADRFREATPEEDLQDIERINTSGAHLVFVGRGCPRQEIWVADHLGKVNAAMLAIGAAFDFHAGVLKQAPKWMQNAGLEWFFRLLMEPRRLFKRYLVTNSHFIYLVLKQLIRRTIKWQGNS